MEEQALKLRHTK